MTPEEFKERWPMVTWQTETSDYGHMFNLAVEIGGTNRTCRHAVSAMASRVVEPTEFAPDERVYVRDLAELPIPDDDDDERIVLEHDGEGFYYMRRGALISGGRTEPIEKSELVASALDAEDGWLTWMKSVGAALATGGDR